MIWVVFWFLDQKLSSYFNPYTTFEVDPTLIIPFRVYLSIKIY
jgi:hypothetical protein